MSLRKELLERELSKLGFRRAAVPGACASRDTGASQQQADSGASHPQAADNDASGEHGA